MHSEDIMARDQAYVANTYARFPIALVRGEGARCWDAGGKAYIDLTSGIGVNALGFCDAKWAAAVSQQLLTLQHTSNLFYTEPCGALAQTLCERTGMRKVFFSNSGAESNEGAIKCARKYGHMRHGEACHKIITLDQSFHGRTLATLRATGQAVFHQNFHPFPEGFVHAPANDLQATLALADGQTCAFMIEMVQGEGGVWPLDRDYVQGLATYCRENDVLLIVDEVQTGIGRTGTLFAYEQFGIAPDIVTCAKGLGGGLPIGAVLFGERTEDVLVKGDHATTFGAGPALCAGALEVLNRMDGAFLSTVREKGEHICKCLMAMPGVTVVSGLGMMLGISLEGVAARDLAQAVMAQGVLVLTAKDRLRLLPPLSITWDEMNEALDILEKTMKAVQAQ